MRRTWAVLLLAIVAAAATAAAPGDALAAGSAGRVFTLGRMPLGAVAITTDGAVWGLQEARDDVLRRLRPGETQPLAIRMPATVAALAADPGGGLLWADSARARIWRRAPAGADTPVGPEGLQACATALAATPSGRVVFADSANAVRVVEPDGTAQTLWAADELSRTTPCPWSAPAQRVQAVAVTPDGTIYALIADALWRLGADGAATRLTAIDNPGGIAAAPDGSLVLTSFSGLYRWQPGAPRLTPLVSTIAATGTEAVFDGDGTTAAAFGGSVDLLGTAAAVAADGGVVATVAAIARDVPDRLVYVAPPKPARLAVALDARASRVTGRRYVAAVRLARAARVRVTAVDARRRVVASRTLRLRAGVTPVALRVRRSFGAYTVTADARQASDAVRIWIGSTLPVAKVRAAVPDTIDLANCGIRAAGAPPTARAADCSSLDVPTRPGSCVRRGALRVDCAYSWKDERKTVCGVLGQRMTPFGTLVADTAEIRCAAGGRAVPRSPRDVDLALDPGSSNEQLP